MDEQTNMVEEATPYGGAPAPENRIARFQPRIEPENEEESFLRSSQVIRNNLNGEKILNFYSKHPEYFVTKEDADYANSMISVATKMIAAKQHIESIRNNSESVKIRNDLVTDTLKKVAAVREVNPRAVIELLDDSGNFTYSKENAIRVDELYKDVLKAKEKTSDDTADIKNVNYVAALEEEAQKLKTEGGGENSKLADKLLSRASMMREQMKGQETQIGYDDQGRPIVQIGKNLSKPTVATQSQAQQKLLRYENSVQLLNHLEKKLKPEHLGVAGVTGEWIMDKGLSQLIPEVANRDRIDARSVLVAAREGLMREMSNDPRFSNMDREEISKALPSSGMFESLPDAKQRIETVRKVITDRAKIYSKGLGQTPPVWSLSRDEIIAEHQKFLDSGGKEGLNRQAALDALTRFH